MLQTYFNVNTIASSANFISILVLNDPLSTPWMLTCVYGPTIPTLKVEILENLARIGNTVEEPWYIIGYFNAIVDYKDKIGGSLFTSRSHCRFRLFIDNDGLLDMGYVEFPFTWNHCRARKANIQEMLDRGLCNTQWRAIFPQASIHHLPTYNSNHKSLLLYSISIYKNRPKLFRFEGMWHRDPTIGLIVSKA